MLQQVHNYVAYSLILLKINNIVTKVSSSCKGLNNFRFQSTDMTNIIRIFDPFILHNKRNHVNILILNNIIIIIILNIASHFSILILIYL